MMDDYMDEFISIGQNGDFTKIVDDFNADLDRNNTYVNLKTRANTPGYTGEEFEFMRFLPYDKAKFIPV